MLFAQLVEFGPTPPDEDLMRAHRAWMLSRFAEGSFVLAGRLDGQPPSAMALFEARDLATAKTLVDTEPMFSAGICTHRVVPFSPTVRAAGMDARFGDDVKAIPAVGEAR